MSVASQEDSSRTERPSAPQRSPARPKVGIVGHSQAGKSTFLAILLEAFAQRGYVVVPEATNRGYLEQLASFIDFGFFPPKTPFDGKDRRVRLNISRKERGTNISLDVEFFDPAGEIFERDPTKGLDSASEQARQTILNDLLSCTGMIVLMDLEADPELLLRTFSNTVVDLQSLLAASGRRDAIQDGKLTLPIAILFTKADTLGWQRRQRVRDAQSWVNEQGRYNKLTERVATYCKRVNYYFCSSSGWIDGRPNVSTVVRPRPLTGSTDSQALPASDVRGEHIPDPALTLEDVGKISAKDSDARLRFMSSLPIFTDPMRLMAFSRLDRPIPREDNRFGVYSLFRGPRTKTVAAWNIVEPVLWAAGVR